MKLEILFFKATSSFQGSSDMAFGSFSLPAYLPVSLERTSEEMLFM